MPTTTQIHIDRNGSPILPEGDPWNEGAPKEGEFEIFWRGREGLHVTKRFLREITGESTLEIHASSWNSWSLPYVPCRWRREEDEIIFFIQWQWTKEWDDPIEGSQFSEGSSSKDFLRMAIVPAL